LTVVAGVDSSTQSTTVVLRDSGSGRVLGTGRSPHPATFPPVSEQNPADWWRALTTAFAQARESACIPAGDIKAVSIAAQCHGLIALDCAGEVIRPVKLWNDTTSAAQMEKLTTRIGVSEWVQRTGSLPTAAFTVSKLAWLAENEPSSLARLAKVLLPHDWLTWRLTGRFVTDRSEATGTGYYNAPRNSYDMDILSLIDPNRDWKDHLPTVLGPSEAAGRILPHAADELGISRDALVGAGSGDQHASAVGLGATPGDLVFVFGTSGVIYGLSPVPVNDASGMINCVADATGGYQPLVCTLNAAKVTDTMARVLQVSHPELSELALAAPRDADRPVMAAYFDGERTPNRPDARGTLTGLSNDLTREALALSAYEGVILGLTRGQAALEDQGVNTGGRVLITGGGAASRAYRQILADLTGREVSGVKEPETVAAGAAVQAAAVLLGESITGIRDRWAPDTFIAAAPSNNIHAQEVRNRYAAVASWRGADTGTALG
jgi:xylulokinase